MDWVTFLYFAIGLGQLVIWGIAYISGNMNANYSGLEHAKENDITKDRSKPAINKILIAVVISIIIFFVGLVPLLIESQVPAKYSRITKQEAVSIISKINIYDQMQLFNDLDFQDFINNEQVVAFEGRALYPRYYPIGEGEPGGDYWQAYQPRDFNHLGFTLVGPRDGQIVLRLDEPPVSFPNASDVIVLGCQMGDYVDAWVVVLLDRVVGNTAVQSAWVDALICPTP